MIQLLYCTVKWTDSGCTTRFSDGAEIPSWPHKTPHYYVISHRTGYSDDILSYCREHDACHSLIEEWLHDKPSDILWAAAHGFPLNGTDSAYEEMATQTFQRWLRANERPILAGVDWDVLKRDALVLLDKAGRAE